MNSTMAAIEDIVGSIEAVIVPLIGRFACQRAIEVACKRAGVPYPIPDLDALMLAVAELRLILIGLVGESKTRKILESIERAHESSQ